VTGVNRQLSSKFSISGRIGMDDFNPYGSPTNKLPAGSDPSQSPVTVRRSSTIVIASALGFGAAGAGIGYGLGVVASSYYRSVFANGNDPGFDPVQVGLGLGLTQGLICGVLVGIVVILAVSYSRRRHPSIGRDGCNVDLCWQRA
jgi:F0F1-type ATP synthase membrane subunit c/vacuolar-type H+-ATPase subunit K